MTPRTHRRTPKDSTSKGTVPKGTTPKDTAKAINMLESFEADYNTAQKSADPQLLEKYFEDLSDDHLKLLCNSANIDARTRPTRMKALAAALLARKTTVEKALRWMYILLRGGMLASMIVVLLCSVEILNKHFQSGDYTDNFMPMAIVVCVFSTTVMHMIENMIKIHSLYKTRNTTKYTRRLLNQIRTLHQNKRDASSKTKKNSS